VEAANSQNWVEKVRLDFLALGQLYNGKPPVYFDNACTTLVPQCVVSAMTEYYEKYPACGGWRSRHLFSQKVRAGIEGDAESGISGARSRIQKFINAEFPGEIIFTPNTTHSINLVALGFNFRRGDTVLISDHEHNSNLIPWLRLQAKGQVRLDHLVCPEDYQFDLAAFERRLSRGDIRLVSLAYTSNLTGYTIPAQQIIKIAHHHGARVLLDAAQTVPHQPVDVIALEVDFLAFSLHKMCGPKGVGVLYAKKELVENPSARDVLEPAILGGGTVKDATYTDYSLLDSPEKFEAGVQDYPGQIASGVAADYINSIGFQRIQGQEKYLNQFLNDQLMERYGATGWFKILGPQDPAERGGILTFDVKRPNAVGISDELSKENNIMLRDGAFCVHSYLNYVLGKGWSEPRMPHEQRMVYRVSLYFYNTLNECKLFVDSLDKIFRDRGYI
jgi:cysteine desulfurase / selenocysteine lyase